MRAQLWLALLFSAGSASSQQLPLPSDADLKTAYCIPIVQNELKLLDGEASTPGVGPHFDAVRRALRVRNDDLARLQSYFLPRVFQMQPMGLLAAQNRANADIHELEANMPRCSELCDGKGYSDESVLACYKDCAAELPAVKRMAECRDFNWLPF